MNRFIDHKPYVCETVHNRRLAYTPQITIFRSSRLVAQALGCSRVMISLNFPAQLKSPYHFILWWGRDVVSTSSLIRTPHPVPLG